MVVVRNGDVEKKILGATGDEHAEHLGQTGAPLAEPFDMRSGRRTDAYCDERLDRPADLRQIKFQSRPRDDSALMQRTRTIQRRGRGNSHRG
jgi:hypothetical protein